MALHFLVDDVPLDAPVGAEIVITGAEAHHAAAVRRVRVGEEVTVGDGRGLWLEAVVTDVAPKRVVAAVTALTSHPAAAPRLVLVQALAKGDRDELAIQAATELGVDEIVPWQAARSVSRWDQAKAAKGVARWQTIVREAAKQAHRAWVPVVSAPVSTGQLAARAASRMLVLEPTASVPLSGVALAPDDARDLVLVVGPEGGITDAELDALTAAGALTVRLGPSVLRTSTAAAVALGALGVLTPRWA